MLCSKHSKCLFGLERGFTLCIQCEETEQRNTSLQIFIYFAAKNRTSSLFPLNLCHLKRFKVCFNGMLERMLITENVRNLCTNNENQNSNEVVC